MKVGAVFAELQAKTADFTSQMNKAGNTLDQFGSKGKRLEDQLKNLERQKQAVGRRLDDLTAKGKTTGAGFYSLSNRSANLTDRISTQKMRIGELASTASVAEGGISGLSTAMTIAGGIALGLVAVVGTLATGIGFLGKSAIDEADSFQQSFIAFETMLGSKDKAGALMKDLIELNKNTPFELKDLLEQTKLLKGFGLENEKLIPTIKMLGDIASGVGKEKLPLIALALGQVKTAGRLTGNELRQFTENGIPLLEELSKIMGMTASDIKDSMEKKGGLKPTFEQVEQALKNLTGQGGRFYDLANKLNKTFSGRVSNIKDAWSSMLRGIAGISETTGEIIEGSLFDRATKAATLFIKFLDDNKDGIIKFGQGIFTTIGNVIDNFIKLGKKTAEYLKPVTDLVEQLKSKYLEKLGKLLVDRIIPAFENMGKKIQKAFAPLEPYIIPALKLLVRAFALFLDFATDVFVANLENTFKAVGDNADQIGEGIKKILAFGKEVRQTYEDIKKGIQAIQDKYNEFSSATLEEKLNMIATFWEKVKTKGIEKLDELLIYIGTLPKKIEDKFKTNFENPLEKMGKDGASSIDKFVTKIETTDWKAVFGNLAYEAGLVGGILLKKVIEYHENLPVWLEKAKQLHIDKYNELVTWTNDLPEKMIKWIKTMLPLAKTEFKNLRNDAVSEVTGITTDLQNKDWTSILFQKGKDLVAGLKKGIKESIKDVLDIVNEMSDKIKKGFSDGMGIQSPSKVFEMFGKYTAQGYQQGLEGQTVQTAQATAGMASASVVGAVSVNQSNAININGAQDTGAIMNQVKQFLATQNNLAFNGVL